MTHDIVDHGSGRVRRLLRIAGSFRRGSHNQRLLEAAAEAAPYGMMLILFDGLDTLPLFDEDLERDTDGGPEPVRRLRDAAAAADALLIATPDTRLGQSHLRQVLAATESLVLPAPALFIPKAERVFDEHGKLVDASTQAALAGVLRRFAIWTDATAPDRAPASIPETAMEQPTR